MNDNGIPTPETDACVHKFYERYSEPFRGPILPEGETAVYLVLARSLERRLIVARGALGELASWHEKKCKYYPLPEELYKYIAEKIAILDEMAKAEVNG